LRPLNLELKNFCQHRKFQLDYKAGITGLVGANGSGKSNLVDTAQFYAITGKIANGALKADLLHWDAAEGHTRFVFEHDGLTWVLTRSLTTSSVVLENETTKVRGAEANELVEKMLGMPFDVFYETCFVPQGRLVEVLTMPHSQRLEYFQRISGVRQAEVIRGMLQAGLEKLPLYPDMEAEIAEMTATLDAFATELVPLQKKWAQLGKLEVEFDAQRPKVDAFMVMPTKAQHGAAVAQARQALEQARATRAKFLKESGLANKIEVVPDFSAHELQVYNYYQELPEHELTAKEHALRIKVLQESLASPATEAPTDLGKQLKACSDKLLELTPEYKLAANKICPTCGRESELSESECKQVKKKYEVLQAQQKKLQTAFDERHKLHEEWVRRCDNLKKELASAETEQRVADERFKKCKAACAEFDLAAYREKTSRIQAYRAYCDKKEQTEKLIQELDARVSKHEKSLEITEKEPYIDDQQRSDAELFLQNYNKIKADIMTLHSRIVQIEAQSAATSKFRDKHIQEQEKRAKIERVRHLFEQAREVLHRDRLPKVVMRTMLNALNSLLEKYLAMFDTTFTSQITDDFDFVVAFEERENLPARILSGGQKVALSIAFRFALSELLSSSISLLAMDEPTVWLDESNIERVVEVLKAARSYTEKGVVVLVATHEEALETAFSRTVAV
jgi:DNA repair exonuclease SbcCD ATPase subunit